MEACEVSDVLDILYVISCMSIYEFVRDGCCDFSQSIKNNDTSMIQSRVRELKEPKDSWDDM